MWKASLASQVCSRATYETCRQRMVAWADRGSDSVVAEAGGAEAGGGESEDTDHTVAGETESGGAAKDGRARPGGEFPKAVHGGCRAGNPVAVLCGGPDGSAWVFRRDGAMELATG